MSDDRPRLLTLVQVSDLHFGPPDADGSNPPLHWRRSSVFDGLLGHHQDALIHLTSFVRDLRRVEKPLRIVVTGDLTSCGRKSEFELSRSFLTGYVVLGGSRVGLGVADAMSQTIPGNHDHWPGTGKVTGKCEHFADYFPELPIPRVSIALAGGRTLSLLGIDSDADVWPHGIQRRWARGSFGSQLPQLEKKIGPPKKEEIRVLLVHHSPAHQSRSGALMIDRSSRRALQELIKRAGISLLLTGHVHVAGAKLDETNDRGTAWDVLEARAGTTTQLDEIPLTWVAAGTNPDDRLPRNTLLVHRLFDTGTTIEWECELFGRLHHGFESAGPLTIKGKPLPPVVVWPRGKA